MTGFHKPFEAIDGNYEILPQLSEFQKFKKCQQPHQVARSVYFDGMPATETEARDRL